MKNEHQKTVFRTPYTDRLRVGLDCGNKGGAKQEFKAECDINNIMARYRATGVLPDLALAQNGRFLDATGLDYQDAMQTIANAQSVFNELPADLRYRFENNPGKFLEFTSNDENRAEMARMGLLRPDVTESIRKAAEAAQAAPAASTGA